MQALTSANPPASRKGPASPDSCECILQRFAGEAVIPEPGFGPLPERSSVKATLLAEHRVLAVVELFGDATRTIALEPVEEARSIKVSGQPQEQVDVLGHDHEGGEAGAIALHRPKEEVSHELSMLRSPEDGHEVEHGGCGHDHLPCLPTVSPVLVSHASALSLPNQKRLIASTLKRVEAQTLVVRIASAVQRPPVMLGAQNGPLTQRLSPSYGHRAPVSCPVRGMRLRGHTSVTR